jgi:peptidoglycan hydrolase-like protein with peptidoglycan-binding domain
MAHLTTSVGRGGHNRRDDVLTVQRLINAKLAPGTRLLRVDGICGPLTIAAISDYQRTLYMNPDSRVDPGGRTLRALSAAGPVQPPQAVPPHTLPAQAPPAASAAGAGTVQGAMTFFTQQGWSAAQAAGIVANLQAESDLRPDALGDGGQAYGVAQWHRDRQANFQNFAGRSIQGSTVDDQLRFVQHELTAGNERAAGQRLRNATSADEAGSIVSRFYERPADQQGEATRRGTRAARIFNDFSNP